MTPPYSVPIPILINRHIMRPLFRGLFHILSEVRTIGRENIPSSGPYLIAINHISIFEPPLILAFWPLAPEAVGAVEIWERRGQATLVRLYGGIKVNRGEFDRQLLDTMLAVLQSGRPLLIAPEGGRTHQPGMRRALPGIAYAADKSGVPVVPVGIVGTTEDFFHRAIRGGRPKLEIRIGRPRRLPPITGKGILRRKALQRNADFVMYQIATLLPEEYRGVYADNQLMPVNP